MLLFMIGLPRSGKSTWANKWRDAATESIFLQSYETGEWAHHKITGPRVVVSGDDIRTALYGQRYNSHMEEYIFALEHTMIKALLARGHDVLVDDTHTTWKSIDSLLQIDPFAVPVWHPGDMYGKSLHRIPSKEWVSHIQLCKERAVQTQQEDLIPVIDRMAGNLERIYTGFEDKLAQHRLEARTFKHRIV